MAIRYSSDFWVGVEQRADGVRLGWPEAYVTLRPKGDDRLNMTAEAARAVAKKLNAMANVIDPPKPPPKPRKKKG